MNKIRRIGIGLCVAFATVAFIQESKESIMEKRARAMSSAINSHDREIWKKFIQENYSQALIDRPMKATVQVDGQSSQSSSDSKVSNLEAKTKMFDRLHNDFAGSKITSIKSKDNKTEMVLSTDTGLKGIFNLTFETERPYLISALGVEVEN